jgi:ATP-dependent protease HslVU (ClpYQ) ATPase subunit
MKYTLLILIVPKSYYESFNNKISLVEVRERLENWVNDDKEKDLTPSKIKEELDKYIIGQDKVKIAVANSLRTRWRKRTLMDNSNFKSDVELDNNKGFYLNSKLADEDDNKINTNSSIKELNSIEADKSLKEMIYSDLFRSHNMLIMGKSGSGKTEILRETAKICNSPFIKVDAVRFTEVGYHGDDVEVIITELYNKTLREYNQNMEKLFWEVDSVKKSWEEFILTFLLGSTFQKNPEYENLKKKLFNKELENLEINLMSEDLSKYERITVADIRKILWVNEFNKLGRIVRFYLFLNYFLNFKLKTEEIVKKNIEQRGIICIDEFDKLIKDVRYLYEFKTFILND